MFTALCGLALAQSVTPEEAATAAQRFFESQGKTLVRCAKVIGDAHDPALYIFNAENGFVIISGDKSVQPVLSFSDHQIYNDADVVPPFEMWVNHYANQINQVKKQHIVQPQFVSRWEGILAGAPAFRTGDEVEPLLHSHWDQGTFYNYYCPEDASGQNGHVVTGCVATAMAQLLYYYRFPDTGTGSYTYTDEHYGVQSADYGNTTYDYNAMCDDPTAINLEICKLIYHCGVGVDMVYGPDGSGMYNHSAAKVLRTHFKYSPETQYLYRDSTDLNWDSVIVSHLIRRIPMYYAGWSVPNINGHGFICDGYQTVDSSYYFHFNFGWSGYMDNYYYTNSLFVGSSNFNLAQELIINGYPDTAQYLYPTPQPLTGSLTLTSDESTFTSGNPAATPCGDGMDFTWDIQPSPVNLEDISLTIRYDIASGDTLLISSTSANFNEFVLTNDTGTFHADINAQNIQVSMRTHSANSNGFRATYTAHRAVLCNGLSTFSAGSGNINDGSGDSQYNNFSDCRYRINLANDISAISFHINQLDLEEGHDFLHFYNKFASQTNLLFSLTGHITDSTFVVNSNRVFIVFESDESGQDNGFSIDYQGGHVGINDLDNRYAPPTLYPNPATGHVTVKAGVPVQHVEIRDISGRTVLTEAPNSESVTLSIGNLPAGIYMVTLRNGDRSVTRKLVKMQ